MVRHMLGNAPLQQRIAFFDRTGSFDDEGFGHFSFSLGLDTDNDAVIDRRVGEEMGFKLGWGDLVTFGLDQSAGPISTCLIKVAVLLTP